MNGAAASSAAGVREVGDVKLMVRSVEGIEMKDLKSLVDDGKKQLGSGVVAIVGVTEEGKAGVVVGVTTDLTSRYNAVDLVRVASEALGGKGGGGRPDMAQAGGPDGAKAECRARLRSKRRWPGHAGESRGRASGRRWRGFLSGPAPFPHVQKLILTFPDEVQRALEFRLRIAAAGGGSQPEKLRATSVTLTPWQLCRTVCILIFGQEIRGRRRFSRGTRARRRENA